MRTDSVYEVAPQSRSQLHRKRLTPRSKLDLWYVPMHYKLLRAETMHLPTPYDRTSHAFSGARFTPSIPSVDFAESVVCGASELSDLGHRVHRSHSKPPTYSSINLLNSVTPLKATPVDLNFLTTAPLSTPTAKRLAIDLSETNRCVSTR